MSKRKRWKQADDDPLSIAIGRERVITAGWYARMSGQIPWKEGERELYTSMTASIEREIHSMSREKSPLN